MAIVWPPELPQRPLISNYRINKGSTLIRTAMDTGPAKVRRRQSQAVDLMSVTFTMNAAQLDVLDNFIENGLYGGVKPFEFPKPPDGDDMLNVRVVPQENSLYQLNSNSTFFNVSLVLEVLP